MKAVILAGGFGSRISEESISKPKPMIPIGDMPIIWHIMKIYSCYGVNDFVICCGYKGYFFKEFFLNYLHHTSDVTIDIKSNKTEIHSTLAEPWKITLADTGEHTMTGGRLKRIFDYVKNEDYFFMTYGDGLSNINLNNLLNFHKKHNKLATVTAVYPPGRFGALKLNGENVEGFQEKPKGDGGFINGGFFVLSPKVLKLIEDDNTIFEREPMEKLAKDQELKAFIHDDFWQPMDTLREKNYLDDLWKNNQAPWKMWNE